MQIFIEIPKLAERAEAKSPGRREFFEKFALAMTRMPDCEEAPDDFGDEFFEMMFEAADTLGYAPGKKDQYNESIMNEFKIQATLAEATYDAREAGLKQGREEGRVEGIAKGAAEATLSNAKAFKAAGIPIETIAQCTGLTPEEVSAL